MNNKTIRSNILHTISSRINPYSTTIQYEHSSCGTCITKKPTKPIPSKTKKNQLHENASIQKASKNCNMLSIMSQVYDLKFEGAMINEIEELLKEDNLMISHHYREQVRSEEISVDTRDKFVCVEEYMREIRDSIQSWVDQMINYMHLQEESLKEKVLPFQQKLDLLSYKFQCFDRIDIMTNLLKHPRISSSSSKLIDTKKTIASSTTIQNPEKTTKQLQQQYTRMLFLQALSLQNTLTHKIHLTMNNHERNICLQ